MRKLHAILFVLLVASFGAGDALARNIAVLNENSTITLVDPVAGVRLGSISIPDPDGTPSTPSRPVCLAASTAVSDILFVMHEDGWLSVINTTAGVVERTYPVFNDLFESSMTLTDCAAAQPRRLRASLGTQVKHYLHLIGGLADGRVVGVVMDQKLLQFTGSPALFDAFELAPNGTPLGVVSLNTPVGDAHQRAYYQVGRSDALGDYIDNIELFATDVATAGFVKGDITRFPGSSALTRIEVGHPYDRELPVMALPGGALVNLDTGGSCPGMLDVDEVVISGPGVNAYSVMAISRARSEIRFVDAISCNDQFVAAPPSPTALLVEDEFCWEGGFIASYDDDTLVPLNVDGTLGTPISLRPATVGRADETTRGVCQLCPVDAEWFSPSCSIEQIDVSVGEFDVSPGRDVRISVDSTCPPQTKFRFKCQCFEKNVEDCPCICDCDLPPDQIDPACECGALPLLQTILGPLPFALMTKPGDDFIGNNPWRKLGDFIVDGPIVFPDIGEQDGSWVYTVEPLP